MIFIVERLLSSIHTIDNQEITALKNDVIDKDSKVTDFLKLVGHQYRRKEFEQLDKKAAKILAVTEQAVQKLQEMEKADTLKWLSEVQYTDRHNELQNDVRKDNPGSGKWFIESTEFRDWKKNPRAFLWLNGVSGCGKSSMSTKKLFLAFSSSYFSFKTHLNGHNRGTFHKSSLQCQTYPDKLNTD